MGDALGRALSGLPEQASVADVIASEKVRAAIAAGSAKLRLQSGGSSSGHATRALERDSSRMNRDRALFYC
jgi:hypothetical protein